jgi:hypothetical protein
MENLETYLRRTLNHNDFTAGLEELFGSPHMRTRILNKPQKATNHQLLQLAEITGLSAAELMEKFNVGMERVSDLEKQHHKMLHHLQTVAA